MSRFFSNYRFLIRLAVLSTVVLYLLGYQPALRFPPIKRAYVVAQGLEQSVTATPTHPVQLPHPGYVSTRFSLFHPGVDIATGLGMPIHPILPGKVVETVYSYFGLGHYVILEHQGGLRSTYGHMGRIYVQASDVVEQSTIIGTVGLTGHTSGPHTHLEVSKDSNYIDPLTLLPSLPNWPDPKSYPAGGKVVESTQPQPVREIKVNLKKELKFSL